MSAVWATFSKLGTAGTYLRQETKLYFHDVGRQEPTDIECVGVVYMCNPGTPKRVSLPRTHMMLDPTLGKVAKVMMAAESLKNTGTCTFFHTGAKLPKLPCETKRIPYLAVLNLFYATGSNDRLAWLDWKQSGSTYSESIPSSARFIWCAWGGGPTTPSRSNIPVAVEKIKSLSIPAFGTYKHGNSHAIGSIPGITPRHPLPYSCTEMQLVANKIAQLL